MKKIVPLISLYASNAMVYAFNALFYSFLPLYFNDRFPPMEAGILLSIGPAVSIIAPMFWGMLADRAKYKNSVLCASVLISALFFYLLGTDADFLPMCVLAGVTMLFMSPFAGLIDTITLEYTDQQKIAYGPIRVMGTVGFGIISLIANFFAGAAVGQAFLIYVIMALLCTVTLLLSPKVEGHAHTAEKGKNAKTKTDIRPLLCAKKLWIIVFFMLVVQFAHSYYVNYFPGYLRDELGLPQWLWGLNVLILVLGEIPFFFLYNKLFSKCRMKTILLVTLAFSALRYLLLGLCENIVLIILLNLLTGFLVTVVTYCGATYITHYIAPELQATGQNLMYCIGQGIARMFGGIVGGLINTGFGTSGGMYLFGAALVVSTVICIHAVWRDPSPQWNTVGEK